jgi:hypothetical protein
MDDSSRRPSGGSHQPRRLSRRVFVKGALSLPPAMMLASLGHPRGAAAASPYPLTNFVFGHLCVVVSASVTDPKALYEATRSWLNSRITSLVRAAAPVNQLDPVDRELNPGSLRPYLPQPDDGKSVVSWLVPQPEGALDRWVVLDPPVQGSVRQVLLFYAIGVGQSGDDLEALVRRLVNAVNRSLRLSAGWLGTEFHVDAATPNWFVVAAIGQSCGGPGGKTEPAPAGQWRLSFTDQAIESARAAAAQRALAKGRSDVVVAILDTCPDPAAVANAASGVFGANRLLKQVAKSVSIGLAPSLTAAAAGPSGPSGPVLPNWQGPEQVVAPSDLLIPDHGLFVAGIVRDLAPATEVHLVRVLGDHGVGTLQGLVHVLSRLPGAVNPSGLRRLIVSLSLVVDVPTSYRIVERWFPGLSGDEYQPGVLAALGHLDASVRAAVDALNRQGVLVVAAAGNDALPSPNGVPTRALPRAPARLGGVLSVAALKRDGTPASYSNQATVPPLNPLAQATSNGVAVLGGEASLRSGWWGPPPAPAVPPVPALPKLFGPRFVDLTPGGPVDAVAGIVSAARLPVGGVRNPTTATTTPTNTTGWVYWVGTSFATPIVSALAAALWELDASLPPVDLTGRGPSVLAKVQGFAQVAVPALGCRGLEVKQA